MTFKETAPEWNEFRQMKKDIPWMPSLTDSIEERLVGHIHNISAKRRVLPDYVACQEKIVEKFGMDCVQLDLFDEMFLNPMRELIRKISEIEEEISVKLDEWEELIDEQNHDIRFYESSPWMNGAL